VVLLAFYLGDARGLYLGEEFHFNQLEIISARACSHPQRELFFNEDRIIETLVRLFCEGTLQPYGLPDPIVTPDELPKAYGKIRHASDEVIKVAVRY
jgi:threonine dehydrogenase-like Zn-dependent dehydrogenase